MPRNEGIEFADEGRVIAESEAGLPNFLLRHDVEFVEPHRLEPRPLVIGELLKRRTAPARQSFHEQFNGRRRVRRGARLLAQQFETSGVYRVVRNLKHVARWSSKDFGVGTKDPAQPRENALQHARGIRWRAVAPQLVAQSVGRNDGSSMGVQQSKRQRGLGSTDWNWLTTAHHFDRPEHPKVEIRLHAAHYCKPPCK